MKESFREILSIFINLLIILIASAFTLLTFPFITPYIILDVRDYGILFILPWLLLTSTLVIVMSTYPSKTTLKALRISLLLLVIMEIVAKPLFNMTLELFN